MTLREWVEWGAVHLQAGPHPGKARRDSELLLLHQIGKDRAWLIAHGDEPFAGCGSIGFAELIKRRRTGEPIQYITGTCEFFGIPFHVTRSVLIPRPETELLVERAIEYARGIAAQRILDIGTGSGAIAVALAHSLPQSHITATDVSSAALTVARENAQRNGVTVRFLEGDLLAPVSGESFELIVSNPPYVSVSDRASLDVEVREYEPELALFAGGDGLSIYRRLIAGGFARLVRGGWLLLEIGCGQLESVTALCHSAGFERIATAPDLQGIPRVIAAVRS